MSMKVFKNGLEPFLWDSASKAHEFNKHNKIIMWITPERKFFFKIVTETINKTFVVSNSNFKAYFEVIFYHETGTFYRPYIHTILSLKYFCDWFRIKRTTFLFLFILFDIYHSLRYIGIRFSYQCNLDRPKFTMYTDCVVFVYCRHGNIDFPHKNQ